MTPVEHFIVDTAPGSTTLATACGETVQAFPIPPDDAPRCTRCESEVESGRVE